MEENQLCSENNVHQAISEDSDSVIDGVVSDEQFSRKYYLDETEKTGQIAEKALKFFVLNIEWFLFIEILMLPLASLGGLAQSLVLIGFLNEDNNYVGLFKTVFAVVGFVIYSLFVLQSMGLLLLVPFFFLFLYTSHAHIFRRLNRKDQFSTTELKVVRKQEFDLFNLKKLAAIYLVIIVFVVFIISFSVIGVKLTDMVTANMRNNGKLLNFYLVFITVYFFIMYLFLNPMLRLGLCLIYVKNVYGNTLRSISKVYQYYFREFFLVNFGYSLIFTALVLIIPMMEENYIDTDFELLISIGVVIGLYVLFSIESTFWVMFVKSRLPEIRTLIQDTDISETRVFAMGKSEDGDVLSSKSYFNKKVRQCPVTELIEKDEEVWNIELEEIEEDDEDQNNEVSEENQN